MRSLACKSFALFSVLACLLVAMAPGAAAQGIVGGESATWRKQSALPTGRTLNAVDMISPTEAWAVGQTGTIIHTADGGSNWAVQNSGTTEPLNAVHFKD